VLIKIGIGHHRHIVIFICKLRKYQSAIKIFKILFCQYVNIVFHLIIMKKFFSNLNPRLIVIHLVGFWFFAFAFFTLGFLHDYNFLHLSSEHMLLLNDKPRFVFDMEFIRQAGNFGMLAAYIISWAISTKRNWHWVNSVFVFMVAFILYNLGYFGWNILHGVFQTPGKLFPSTSIWAYLTNGVIMLAIGTLIFFSKRLVRYIEKNNKVQKKPSTNHKKPVPASR
jgi:hypothetical protein